EFDSIIRAMEATSEQDAVTIAEKAVALYRGEFLANVKDEGWAIAWREEYREKYLNALRAIVKWYRGLNEWEPLRQYAATGFASAPDDEEFCAAMMSIASNDRNIRAIEDTYTRYTAARKEVHGLPPSTLIQNLRSALLRRL
ncbi:MAG TPA: bacterial transcriptional activator domain-containing protein, partial [Candidatus Kapabacteria bacterium]|nr:bacterial transcriptional activator domain-containing protein [Candidatus Kapabacteria bacterium]